jgi:hypothetical protein
MSWGMVAVAGATLVGGAMSSKAQKDAAKTAAGAQDQAALAGIEEQRRQFDAVRALLAPYTNAGNLAMGGQLDLLGLNGQDAQRAAIEGVQGSPEFTAALKQGEDAILANASATGGLRGGNVQGALAQFRPALLSSLIQQRFARLGGLTAIGQNAAAGVGNAGMQTGQGVSALFQQQGAAQAGAALAGGRADAGLYGAFGSAAGMLGAGFAGRRIAGYAPSGAAVTAGGAEIF